MTEVERNQLIEAFAYLVPRTRRRLIPVVPWRVSAEDLEGEGYLALVRAADKFDAARGTQFKTLAIAMIRGAMLEELRRQDWLPRSVRDWQKRFQRAEEALVCRGEPVTWETLAAALSVTQEACEALWQICQEPEVASLDEEVRTSYPEGPITLGETIEDPAPGPEEVTLERLEQQWAASMARWLPRRERKAMLLTTEGTNEWAAQRIGTSETRVWQLRQQARERLGKFVRR